MKMTAEEEFDECLDLARQLVSGSEEIADLWEANELCNRALRLRPDDSAGWLVKAQVLLQLEDGAAALSAVEMALRTDPHSPEARYLRAAALAQMERFDEALTEVGQAFHLLDATPEDDGLGEELYFEKASILDALDRSDEALLTFEAGLLRYPDSDLLKAGAEPLRRQQRRKSWQVLDGGLA